MPNVMRCCGCTMESKKVATFCYYISSNIEQKTLAIADDRRKINFRAAVAV
jgi:hypothetical protein